MRIERTIDKTSFGIYKCTKPTYYGHIDRGVYRNNIIDISTAYNSDNTLRHKLYYVTDKLDKWIKSKLKFFRNNKCYYTTRGEAR